MEHQKRRQSDAHVCEQELPRLLRFAQRGDGERKVQRCVYGPQRIPPYAIAEHFGASLAPSAAVDDRECHRRDQREYAHVWKPGRIRKRDVCEQ